jgi:phage-related baseplate assembly protein
MTPELRIQDAGGDTIQVSLVFPNGRTVSRWVLPQQMEGQAGKDLLASLQREAEGK